MNREHIGDVMLAAYLGFLAGLLWVNYDRARRDRSLQLNSLEWKVASLHAKADALLTPTKPTASTKREA